MRTWTDSYLRGGTFDGVRPAEYIGTPWTKAATGIPADPAHREHGMGADEETARDLLAYEKRIDEYLRTVPDIIVCTYDLNHHSARTIAEVISAHPVALVGGVLRMNRGPPGRRLVSVS